jgi:LysR family transcriptional activator of nhaA
VLSDIVQAEHRLAPVATIDSIVEHFYMVAVERRERHPAVQRILDQMAGVFERN